MMFPSSSKIYIEIGDPPVLEGLLSTDPMEKLLVGGGLRRIDINTRFRKAID